MKYEIDREKWSVCNICGKTINEIKKEFGGSGSYYSQSFLNHIKEAHKEDPSEYFEKISDRPTCSCGICNKKTDVSYKGSKIYWKEFKCGRNDGVLKWSENAKKSRIGKNNPMFGKKPWNKGIKATDDERVMRMAMIMRSGFDTDETRRKMSIAAVRRLSRGDMPKSKTVPHCLVCNILDDMNIKYEKEYPFEKYCFDIYIKEHNIAIEVDGDFWHCNPLIYKDGPKTHVQRVNAIRDAAKNKFCKENGINIIRIWEFDIKNNIEKVKERLSCILKK